MRKICCTALKGPFRIVFYQVQPIYRIYMVLTLSRGRYLAYPSFTREKIEAYVPMASEVAQHLSGKAWGLWNEDLEAGVMNKQQGSLPH